MKIRSILTIALTFILLAACQPAETQPVFSSSVEAAVIPIPLPSVEPPIAATLQGRIRSFDISPDMATIALATSQGVTLYDLKSFKHLRTLNKTENVFSVAWSSDGKKLAAGGLIMENSEVGKPHLVVWDTSNWQVIFEPDYREDMLDNHYGDVVWSLDSRSIATGNGYMGVTVYNIETGKIISKQDIFSGAIADVSWSPDGSRLVATGDMAFAIRRWRVDTDKFVRLYDQRVDTALKVDWSADGKRIASGYANGTVCLWTVETNKCDGFIQAHQSAVNSLAWSPNGNQLATGGDAIRIWDSHTGKLIATFGNKNDNSVYTPSYVQLVWPAPDQPLTSLVALDSFGNEALMVVYSWDVGTGKVLFEFYGESDPSGK